MSVIVVDFRARQIARFNQPRSAGQIRAEGIEVLIAECVASMYREPPDRLHAAIRSAVHELLGPAAMLHQSVERSAS